MCADSLLNNSKIPLVNMEDLHYTLLLILFEILVELSPCLILQQKTTHHRSAGSSRRSESLINCRGRKRNTLAAFYPRISLYEIIILM